jgi:hypothetical protein
MLSGGSVMLHDRTSDNITNVDLFLRVRSAATATLCRQSAPPASNRYPVVAGYRAVTMGGISTRSMTACQLCIFDQKAVFLRQINVLHEAGAAILGDQLHVITPRRKTGEQQPLCCIK